MPIEPMLVVKLVADALEAQQIVYWIGGSIASTKYGEFRTTQDVDFVAYVREENVPALLAAWSSEFYADDEMMLDAIKSQSSFNIIHLNTGFKADIFIAKSDAWTEEEASRRRSAELISGDATSRVYLSSPEDLILQKLRWFRLGGEVSDRQWLDVQKVLKTQKDVLEYDYMKYWAQEVGLMTLLEQAMEAASV